MMTTYMYMYEYYYTILSSSGFKSTVSSTSQLASGGRSLLEAGKEETEVPGVE